MELFDVLPERFFGLLAGKCRRIYAEAGLCLYEQYRLAQFGIEQEILRDKFQELIESWAEAGVAYEDEDFSAKDADTEESRAKANHMIRRMKEFGWLDYEQRENFKIFILLPHYSSRLWGLFANLCEGRAVEYQRFAFTTYQVLSGEAAKAQPSMAVLEAERLAEEFVEELRILLNNIKSKMEQVSAQTSLQDVLSHHFVEYRGSQLSSPQDLGSRLALPHPHFAGGAGDTAEQGASACPLRRRRTPSACRLCGGGGIPHERIAADDRGDLSGTR